MKSTHTFRINLAIVFLLTLLLIGFKFQAQTQNLHSFDVSADGKEIVYSYKLNEEASLYKCDKAGAHPKLLLSDKLYSFTYPKFSPDGKNIVCVAVLKTNTKIASVWMIDLNGTVKEKTQEMEYVFSPVFSKYTPAIYFTKANEYDAYSPLAPKQAHGFDIYSWDLTSGKTSKISNLNAYNIGNIVEVNKDTLLADMIISQSGLYYYTIGNQKVEKLLMVNDDTGKSEGLSNANLIDENTVIGSSWYRMVKIDLKKKMEETILPTSGYHFIQIVADKTNNRILFTKTDNTNTIYHISFGGKELSRIEVEIP